MVTGNTLLRIDSNGVDVDQVIRWAYAAFDFLLRNQFIKQSDAVDSPGISATTFGVASCLSGIPPKDALIVLKSLNQARTKLILKGGLHLVFLVTSPSIQLEPDWEQYERVLHDLYAEHPVSNGSSM